MDRLISEQAVLDTIATWVKSSEPYDGHGRLISRHLYDRIKAIPSAEPKTGHWVKTPYGDCKCSKCNSIFPQLPISYFEPRYCHNCGADMRSDNDGR